MTNPDIDNNGRVYGWFTPAARAACEQAKRSKRKIRRSAKTIANMTIEGVKSGNDLLSAWEKVKMTTVASARVWNAASNLVAQTNPWPVKGQ